MDSIAVFTDGACSGNPGPGGWACIIAYPEGRVREYAGGAPKTTNNRMELGAAITALEAVKDRPEPVVVCTDSTYLISGVTQWLAGWKRRGWASSTGEPVANRDLWEKLDALSAARKGRLSWRYVRGHSGHDGNERCDELAVAFTKSKPVSLYDGPLLEYPVPLDVPDRAPAPERRSSSRGAGRPKASGPATYLSYLDGKLERHSTWAACEARVRGRSGARFKKVTSADEESMVLRSWGLAS